MRRKPSVSAEDAELFRREVGAVRPLRHNRAAAAPARPQPLPRQTWREQAKMREEMLYGDFDPAELETGDELVFIRPGLQRNVLRKLRRGHYSVTRQLDLHGLTVPEAREVLGAFLTACLASGDRCVRIIHGKGNNSRNQQPVLKVKLNGWLRRRNEVLAFCSARPVDGGTGAVYILLGRCQVWGPPSDYGKMRKAPPRRG